MKKILNRLKSTRGEGYIDVAVGILVVMILLVFIIKTKVRTKTSPISIIITLFFINVVLHPLVQIIIYLNKV